MDTEQRDEPRNLRVLVMNYEYPPIGGGGGRVCQQVSEGLAQRGHRVAVLTARQGTLPPHEELGNLTVHRIAAWRHRPEQCGPHEMAAYVVAATVAGFRLARRFQPDVIHAHFAVPTGAAAWAIGRALRIPYVVTAHLGDVPGGVPQQTDRLFRVLFPFTKPIWRDAAATTAVSSFVAQLAARAYGRHPTLILNGIDVASIPAGPPTPHPGSPRLIWVGRMQEQKNLLFGLRALALAREIPWRLDLVGDGPQRAEAEATVRELGLADRTNFHGWLPGSAVHTAMAQSDILFMPSLSEGLSMVAVEALAQGLALLCSDIGGFADVAQDGANAILCPVDDATAYAAALRRLCAEPDLLSRMRAASRKRAYDFSLSAIIGEYEKLLRRASLPG